MSTGSDMLIRVLAKSCPNTARICSNRAATACPLTSSASVTREKWLELTRSQWDSSERDGASGARQRRGTTVRKMKRNATNWMRSVMVRAESLTQENANTLRTPRRAPRQETDHKRSSPEFVLVQP